MSIIDTGNELISIGQTSQLHRRSDVISQIDLLREKLDVESKMNKAKTLEIEALARDKKGKLYSYTVLNHIWLCFIATDKIVLAKENDIEILQEKITRLTLQLMEREERISQLTNKLKGNKQLYIIDHLLYQIICLALQSLLLHFQYLIKGRYVIDVYLLLCTCVYYNSYIL